MSSGSPGSQTPSPAFPFQSCLETIILLGVSMERAGTGCPHPEVTQGRPQQQPPAPWCTWWVIWWGQPLARPSLGAPCILMQRLQHTWRALVPLWVGPMGPWKGDRPMSTSPLLATEGHACQPGSWQETEPSSHWAMCAPSHRVGSPVTCEVCTPHEHPAAQGSQTLSSK